MSVELKVPEVGESITEVQIGEWLKKAGDAVAADEPLVVIETDKVTVELPAPVSGVLSEALAKTGDTAQVGDVIGRMEEGEAPAASVGAPSKSSSKSKAASGGKGEAPKSAKVAAEAQGSGGDGRQDGASGGQIVMPAARRVLAEHDLEAGQVRGTGPGGRLLKEDVERTIREGREGQPAGGEKPAPGSLKPTGGGEREEERVPMSPLRRRVAERLVQAQRQAAILTTFNEIDMGPVMALRKEQQERFVERHGVKLGFMSFFVKAVIEAMKAVPAVGGEIQGDQIVYRNYHDIGIAVGGGKGLVVPVLRDTQRMSFAEIELAIADLAARAKGNKLTLEELQGGTFTISNGGIYGSLLSTPILNPPQSGILGLHAIQDRPMAIDGQVVIRPMMYVALSYDHRMVDGREAVTFLKRIKECVEQPARMLLEV